MAWIFGIQGAGFSKFGANQVQVVEPKDMQDVKPLNREDS